ncbi:MAG: YafY family transcriptional regulator [Cyclobacteriaceae bacterium]|nr:YafY family transcriptional regulator [Cytophagales bacterium]MBX2901263.1 YafY family transcriptional regulator [Cyclobacteriaceae bacterium]
MNRVDRLMGILTVLQAHKFVRAEKISEKFEISIRTVYRDIKALGEIGIPVSFENNKGYFIVQGYFLPPVSLTTHEANALILVAALANRFADRQSARAATEAIEKIRAVLRPPDRDKSEQFSGKVRVLNSRPALNRFLADVQKAITDQIILKIHYTDAKGRNSRREVEPIGIIYYTEQWHLIAWCWKRHDYRDFIMSRIGSLLLTGPFKKKNHITLDEHLQSWN